MDKIKFRGVISPVITPFDKNEELDEVVFRREVRYLFNAGIYGISPGGSTGEGQLISDNELVRMIEIIKEENTKKLPIVAGVIRQSTKDAIRTAKAAQKAGADALMITPVQYLGGTDDNGNYEFYKRISDEVDLPIIIYNVVAQNEIKPEVFKKIADIENVMGVKQSVGGIEAFYEMKMVCGDKAYIYAATDDMMYSCYELGADGAIAAILTLFPELSVKIWEATQAKDYETAKELQNMIYPVWNKIKGPQFPRRIKEALNQTGRQVGISRSPLSEASTYEKECIKKALEHVK